MDGIVSPQPVMYCRYRLYAVPGVAKDPRMTADLPAPGSDERDGCLV